MTVKKEFKDNVQYSSSVQSVLCRNSVDSVHYGTTVAECTSIKDEIKEDSWNDDVYTSTVHILVPDTYKDEVKEEIMYSEDPLK